MMNDQDDKQSIPEGWVTTNLGDILIRMSNGCTKRQSKEKIGIPVTRIETISKGYVDLERVRYLSDLDQKTIDKFQLHCGDILFSHINSDLHLGKTAVFNFDAITVIHGMNLLLLRPKKDISSKFLNFLLSYHRLSGNFIKIAQHAVNQSSINQKKLKSFNISIPPLPEQHRIVAKIEELFTQLDKGVEQLQKVQTQLKTYRQAVLKYAFEGKLTEEWRKAHPQPPAEELLEKIKAERLAHHEAALAKWEAAVQQWEAEGKPGKKPRKPGKLKEYGPLSEEELKKLHELPEGWKWVRYEELLHSIKNGISKKPNAREGIAILRISSVRPLSVNLLDTRFFYQDEGFKDYYLENGDLLFTRYNGNKEFVGVCGMVNNLKRATLYPDKLIRCKLVLDNGNHQSYIEKAVNTGESRKYVRKKVRTTAGQSGISGGDIKNIPVPIAPIIEQEIIVQEIESRLSVCEKVEKTIKENLQKAEALRQSILKKAFEGKLVPQDSNDEPASVLLERIKGVQGEAKQLKLL